MKPQTKLNHLMSGIPNNFLTRWLVTKANKRMAKANSMYRLRIRYRKQKVKGGNTTRWGDVSKNNAKQFSLYLRVLQPYYTILRSYDR